MCNRDQNKKDWQKKLDQKKDKNWKKGNKKDGKKDWNKKDGNVFNVTVGPKTRQHPFFGQGSMLGFIINGVSGLPLYLKKGKSYTFHIDTPGHPFYFTTSNTGGTGQPTGSVTSQLPIVKGTFILTIGLAGLPNTFYYQCMLHPKMGSYVYLQNGPYIQGQQGQGMNLMQKYQQQINQGQVNQMQQQMNQGQGKKGCKCGQGCHCGKGDGCNCKAEKNWKPKAIARIIKPKPVVQGCNKCQNKRNYQKK